MFTTELNYKHFLRQNRIHPWRVKIIMKKNVIIDITYQIINNYVCLKDTNFVLKIIFFYFEVIGHFPLYKFHL